MTSREGTIPAIWDGDLAGRYGVSSERLRDAAERAREAFWDSLVKSFPEVETGDMGPGDELPLEWGGNAAMLTWLMWNHPGARED